jgi:hypothetical protein
MTDHEHMNADDRGYERRDANLKWIFGVGLVGVVLVVAIVVFLNEYFIMTRESLVYESVLRPESAKLRELRAREDEILNSYGAVNAQNGVYRIPIDRAMQIVANEAFSKQP